MPPLEQSVGACCLTTVYIWINDESVQLSVLLGYLLCVCVCVCVCVSELLRHLLVEREELAEEVRSMKDTLRVSQRQNPSLLSSPSFTAVGRPGDP